MVRESNNQPSGLTNISERRRKLLAAIGMSVPLAGCGGDGGGTETETETEADDGMDDGGETTEADDGMDEGDETTTTTSGGVETVDQPLEFTTGVNPEKASFLYYGWTTSSDFEYPGNLMANVLYPPGRYGRWLNGNFFSGPLHLTLLESIDIGPKEWTIKIRDDANWSDGNPIRGKDLVGRWVGVRLANGQAPLDKDLSEDDPIVTSSPWNPMTDVEIGDKQVTFISEMGAWDQIRRGQLLGNRWGIFYPTHIEPYKSHTDAVLDLFERAKKGEVKPWEGGDNPRRRTLWSKYIYPDDTHFKRMRKPENIVTSGAFTVSEIRGAQEIVLEKNEEFPFADRVNYDQAIVKFVPNDAPQRLQASVKNNRVDWASFDGANIIPQHIVQSFPDNLEQLAAPAGGMSIGVNHNHPVLGKRKVRQAIMYAINTQNIAGNVHPGTTTPITKPGGQIHGGDVFFGDDFLDNLISYEQDQEKAATLMEEAGFTKENGSWLRDGEPISIEVATPNSNPVAENTFAAQLTQFGIDVSLRTVEGTTFEEQDFKPSTVQEADGYNNPWALWANAAYFSGFVRWNLGAPWGFFAGVLHHALDVNIWREEVFDAIERGWYRDDGFIRWNEEEIAKKMNDHFTLDMPPMGEPNGDLREWKHNELKLDTTGTQEEFEQDYKGAAWAANWHVPVFPLYLGGSQLFIDGTHWNWPRDSPAWEGLGLYTNPSQMAGWGMIQANADNPE